MLHMSGNLTNTLFACDQIPLCLKEQSLALRFAIQVVGRFVAQQR